MWRRLIADKYGLDGIGWFTRKIQGGQGVGVWKGVSEEWTDFRKMSRFKIGNGRSVLFWEDTWCGERALKERYPNLAAKARCKGATVEQMFSEANLSFNTNVRFLSRLRGEEREMLEELRQLISDVRPSVDMQCW